MLDQLEAFTGKVYQPRIGVTKLAELYWHMLSETQLSWEKLPPIKGVFVPEKEEGQLPGHDQEPR